MEKTELIIQKLVLQEPVTALTDFIVTVLCFVFYFKLGKAEAGSRRNNLWRSFFLFVGLSTFLGGVAHLLRFYLEGPVHKTIWLSMNVLSAISVYFAELSAIEVVINQNKKKLINLIALILLMSFTSLSLYTQNFNIAKINMGIGLVFILISHVITNRRGLEGSLFVVIGMSCSFIPVFIHSQQISLSKWFNFNDISHVFMMLSLYFIFLGVTAINLNEANDEQGEEMAQNKSFTQSVH